MRFLIDHLAQQRDKHVLLHAKPHLGGDEDVLEWVRAEHPHEKRRGYAFLTSRKLLVVWTSHGDGHGAVRWMDISAWGVNHEDGRGPRLGAEAPGRSVVLHIPVGSHGTARRVTTFLRRFARLAPRPRGRMSDSGYAAFDADSAVVVMPARRSAGAQTKRLVVTAVGLLGVVGGLIITPIPGPWSFPIVLGGLALLASEYDWAKDVLDWVRDKSRQTRERLRARRAAREE